MKAPSVSIQGHRWFYSKERGVHHPQEAAFEAHPTHTISIKLEHKKYGSLFSTFDSYNKFLVYYNNYNDLRCFNYIIRSEGFSQEYTPLYFDLDWYGNDENAQSNIKLLKSGVYSALADYGFDNKPEIIVENCSAVKPDGKFKNSYHVFVPDVVFETNEKGCMREFVKESLFAKYLSQYPNMFDDKGIPVVDLGVYTKNRCFRISGSSKINNYELDKPMPDDEFLVRTRLVDRQTGDIVITKDMVAEHVQIKKKTVKRKENKQVQYQPGGLEERIKFLLISRGDEHTEVAFDGVWYRGNTDQVHGRKCLVGGEIKHKENCFFVVRDNGDIYYHCFNGEAHKSCAGVYLGHVNPLIAWDANGNYIGKQDESFDMWVNGTQVYNHDDDYVQPISPTLMTKCYCIKAGCGKGKSTAVSELIKTKKNASV